MIATEVKKQAETIQEGQWTKVIGPKKGWFDIHLSNLWNYRDLIGLFVKRDFVAFYKQTILGPLWFLLQPLFTTLVFTIIFGRIAQIPTDGVPQVLFYMCGIVIWNYFADCLNKTSDTFVSNANIFGKVYFPRLTVPVSIVITNLITFAIQLALFLSFLAYFYLAGSAIKISYWIFLTPLLLLQMAALGLGLGILISSLTTKYRDLRYVVGFGVQLWMYATPIVYPMSQIPEKWQWVFALNPMSATVETARHAFLGAGAIRPYNLGISLGMTALVLFAGIVMFSRIEKTFMDTV
jgi:lipopolysaccharide transport system permease protein